MFESSISSTEGSKNLKCESKYVGAFKQGKGVSIKVPSFKCCENFRENSLTALERRKNGGKDEEYRHRTHHRTDNYDNIR